MPVSVIASRGETVQRFAQPDFIGAMDHPPHNPHDKLFKRTFGDPTTTANFLRHEFSEPLARAIHWDSLKLEPGSFVDSQYRSSESDLLFSTLVGDKPARIYLLFEHQRTQEPTIALRLLRYMVRIWEQFHKSNSTRPLPVILPVVLAHNAEHWEIPVSFAPLLDIPENLHGELAPFVPDFTFKLIQLADIPFDQIRGTPAGILTLRVMKAERLGMLLEDPVWDEDLVRRASLELFEQVLRYIASAADLDKPAFLERLKTVKDERIRQTAMTLEQQFRQEGRQEGLQKGRQEGRQEGERLLLERLLTRRFGPLPEWTSRKLEEATLAQLEKWGDAILDAPSLEAVFRD